jgi:hypothetical protein
MFKKIIFIIFVPMLFLFAGCSKPVDIKTMRYCQADAECSFVNDGCGGCGNYFGINKEYADEYSQERKKDISCWGHKNYCGAYSGEPNLKCANNQCEVNFIPLFNLH